jgi:hypothetical protein
MNNVINFVKFLVAWDEITQAKDVLYKLMSLWMAAKVAGIQEAKLAFNDQISNTNKEINTCVGMTDWPTSIGDIANQPRLSNAMYPSKGQRAGSKILPNQYKNLENSRSTTASCHSVTSY